MMTINKNNQLEEDSFNFFKDSKKQKNYGLTLSCSFIFALLYLAALVFTDYKSTKEYVPNKIEMTKKSNNIETRDLSEVKKTLKGVYLLDLMTFHNSSKNPQR